MACEPAVAFPIQSLQRNEKPGTEEKTGEKRSGSVSLLSSMALQLSEETQGQFLISQLPNHAKWRLAGNPFVSKEEPRQRRHVDTLSTDPHQQ